MFDTLKYLIKKFELLVIKRPLPIKLYAWFPSTRKLLWVLFILVWQTISQHVVASDKEPFLHLDNLVMALSKANDVKELNAQGTSWQRFDKNILRQRDDVFWLRFDLKAKNITDAQLITIHSLMSFTLYVDEEAILTNGDAGNPDVEAPGNRVSTALIPEKLLSDGDHTLLFKASASFWNYENPLYETNNRLIDRMSIRPFGPNNEVFSINKLVAISFAIVNLLLALYLLFLYISKAHGDHFLIFSLCSFAVASVGLFDNIGVLYNYPYHWHFWVWLGLAISISIVSLLFPSIYIRQFKFKHQKSLWLLLLLLQISILTFAPKETLGNWLISASFVYSAVICAVAWQRTLYFAKQFLMGLILCAGAVIISPNYFYVTFTLLLFVTFFSVLRTESQRRELHVKADLLNEQLQAQLSRTNIQPHFLMNCLTLLMDWVEISPQKATQFIDLLAREFKLFSKMSAQSTVTLDEEISLCKLHLEIMNLRLDKPIFLDVDCEQADIMIPPGIFHTLCENAFSHNHYIQGEVLFKLKQRQSEDNLEIEFKTPKSAPVNSSHRALGTGTGTKYIVSRLSQTYGDKFHLDTQESEEYFTTVLKIFN